MKCVGITCQFCTSDMFVVSCEEILPMVCHCVIRSMGEVSLNLLQEGNLGLLKLKSTTNETSMQVKKAALQMLCVCVARSLVLCSVASICYMLG